VSKEIARLTKQVGFRTLVFDDRADFASTERFPGADGIFVCSDFASVFDGLSVTPGSYIVIVTRGHRFDKEALAQALRTEAGYIGMIGSRKKRQSVYQELINEGFQQNELDQVHCPIGLSIDAETPAEIGVSIVAELIQHRANRKSNG
jgi:xanthine dehydrogenase accessory factor